MEREAIERAVDERIKAEREALYSRRGEVSQRDPGTGMGVGVQQVQPLAIVPYVNSRQPLFQYSTAKTYYKFVPDAPEQPVSPAPTRYTPAPVQPKQKKKQCMRVWSIVLMISAMKAVHQYSLTKTIVSIVLTLVAMLLILFLAILLLSLFQQVYVFVYTVYTEISYRIRG